MKENCVATNFEWPEVPPNKWLTNAEARDQIITNSSDESPYRENRDLLLKNYGLIHVPER